MKVLLQFTVAILCIALASCGRNERSAEAVSKADLAVAAPAPPAEAMANSSDESKALSLSSPSRKIIKTADLRCRVSDVFTATTNIERLSNSVGGQISDSKLENSSDEVRSLPYKSDSLKQVSSYTTTAHLNLRIPVSSLDTVLGSIAAQSAFVDSRNLHLDDVTLRYLSNKLKNDAMGGNDAASRARGLARKTGDAVFSGDYTDERNNTRIDRRIENMQLNDQVTYATLTVDLYQPQRIHEMIIPDIAFLMKPTLGQQASLAINNGWQLLKALFIGLLEIWPLSLLALAAIIVFRRYRSRKPARAVLTSA